MYALADVRPKLNADNLGLLVWYGASSALLGRWDARSRAGQAAGGRAAVGPYRDWGADQYLPAGAGGPGGRRGGPAGGAPAVAARPGGGLAGAGDGVVQRAGL